MYYNTETLPMSEKPASPVSFRPDPQQRLLLESVAQAEGVSATEVIKRGLGLVAKSVNSSARMPMYSRRVDDPRVTKPIEAAAAAACEVLDEMMRELGVRAPEVNGISSNFQGLLVEHLTAMLTGDEHARKTYSTALHPLFATWKSFGRVPLPTKLQGYTLMRERTRSCPEELYFNGDHGWVPLNRLDIGDLYTSDDAAVTDTLKHMEQQGEVPRDYPMQLVLIDFESTTKRVA
jgi:hypothetical protein